MHQPDFYPKHEVRSGLTQVFELVKRIVVSCLCIENCRLCTKELSLAPSINPGSKRSPQVPTHRRGLISADHSPEELTGTSTPSAQMSERLSESIFERLTTANHRLVVEASSANARQSLIKILQVQLAERTSASSLLTAGNSFIKLKTKKREMKQVENTVKRRGCTPV
jgi:hypothetical protein